MKKSLGFSSFEFYFVMVVIGVILLFGIQRYNKLADETHRLSFEVLAQNFSAAVYAHHARWITSQQVSDSNAVIEVDNKRIQFSREGWPLGADLQDFTSVQITLPGCFSLWGVFLQNAPAISVFTHELPNTHPYQLKLTSEGNCRYEWTAPNNRKFYFEYSPTTGSVKSQSWAIPRNSE